MNAADDLVINVPVCLNRGDPDTGAVTAGGQSSQALLTRTASEALNNHWTFVTLFSPSKTWSFFDPLGPAGRDPGGAPSVIRSAINAGFPAFRQHDIMTEHTLQHDGYQCGGWHDFCDLPHAVL